MITPNTDSTFIQVKSDNPRNSTWQNGKVTEDIEMGTQFPVKSTVSASTERESKICERTGRLDDLLLKTVDETLTQVFREEGAKVIYNYVENKCHLKREEIVEKSEDFSAGLDRLLGSAAPVIEKLILKNLYHELRLEYAEKEGFGFSDYIKELKKVFVV